MLLLCCDNTATTQQLKTVAFWRELEICWPYFCSKCTPLSSVEASPITLHTIIVSCMQKLTTTHQKYFEFELFHAQYTIWDNPRLSHRKLVDPWITLFSICGKESLHYRPYNAMKTESGSSADVLTGCSRYERQQLEMPGHWMVERHVSLTNQVTGEPVVAQLVCLQTCGQLVLRYLSQIPCYRVFVCRLDVAWWRVRLFLTIICRYYR